MKLLFFSDVHGSPESVDLLMRRIDAHAPDRLVLLGDVLSHGFRNPCNDALRRVVEPLNRWKGGITAVRGNCDREDDQKLLEFPILAEYAILHVDGRCFFLTHGHRWNPENPPPLAEGSVLACGHTHCPSLRKLAGGIISFTPGSVSLPRGGFEPSYGFYANGKLQVLSLETGGEMLAMQL